MSLLKTSELTGPALAYAVAQITPDLMQIGNCFYIRNEDGERVLFNPAENWAQGGPIGETEHLQASYQVNGPHKGEWGCVKWIEAFSGYIKQYGPTELIAKMRCYVASKLGDEVVVPDELTGE